MRGKRLAITRGGSSSDFAARQWVGTLGKRAGEDVSLVQAGGQKEILAAMQANGAEAGVLSAPTDLEARRLGCRELADREAIESAIELVALTNPEARAVVPNRFFDPRFVEELQDRGFIAGLHR
jgi:ABC-type nitrate/sulfonate/bicarbonate transport system substrate-binding protein